MNVDICDFKISFEDDWNDVERKEFVEKFRKGLNALEKIVGKISEPANSDNIWKVIKSEDKSHSNAIIDTEKKEIRLSPNCPWFTFLHELYHLAHARSDFRVDIFEEGIAIAASTLACRYIGEKNLFEIENFEFNNKKINLVPNDPIVPLEQFLHLLPMRYNVLGKFWIKQEKNRPGLLEYMTQIKCKFKQMMPSRRISFLLDALNNFDAKIADELKDLWGMKEDWDIHIDNKYFMLFFDSINKTLHILSWTKIKKNIEMKDGNGIEIFEEIGAPMEIVLFFINKANGLINQPTIKIDSSGYAPFCIENIPSLLGESPNGYLIRAMHGDELLDELDITL